MLFKVLIFVNVGIKEILINTKGDRAGFPFRDENPLKSDQSFHRAAFVASVGQIELRHLFAVTIAGIFNGAGEGKIIWVVLSFIIIESGVAQAITERIEGFFRHEAVGAVLHFVAVEGRKFVL